MNACDCRADYKLTGVHTRVLSLIRVEESWINCIDLVSTDSGCIWIPAEVALSNFAAYTTDN